MQQIARPLLGPGGLRALLVALLAVCAIALPDAAEARRYPKLFDSYEFHSTRIARFPRWTSMLERLHAEATACETETCGSEAWTALFADLRDAPLDRKLREVNARINARRYVADSENWTDPDYWATPIEFMEKSGDCEDFAVAKYMALKALGVPIEDMRVAVVWNERTSSGHAMLVVYVGDEALLLDNLIPTVVQADTVGHYRAIYSINEAGWWLHRYLNPPAPLISSLAIATSSRGG